MADRRPPRIVSTTLVVRFDIKLDHTAEELAEDVVYWRNMLGDKMPWRIIAATLTPERDGIELEVDTGARPG